MSGHVFRGKRNRDNTPPLFFLPGYIPRWFMTYNKFTRDEYIPFSLLFLLAYMSTHSYLSDLVFSLPVY
jgi:hypothetical protein